MARRYSASPPTQQISKTDQQIGFASGNLHAMLLLIEQALSMARWYSASPPGQMTETHWQAGVHMQMAFFVLLLSKHS
jgi:hypothetical protein